MAKRSVVRLDSVQAVYKGGTYSVKASADLENGFIGKLGAIDPLNLDVRTLGVGASGDTVVLVANPAVVKDNGVGKGFENEYFMPEGEVVRAYQLREHDVVSISAEGFGIVPTAVGDIVAPSGYQLEKVASAPATGTALKVVKIEKVGGALSLNVTQSGTTYYVLEVIQA